MHKEYCRAIHVVCYSCTYYIVRVSTVLKGFFAQVQTVLENGTTQIMSETIRLPRGRHLHFSELVNHNICVSVNVRVMC